MTPEELDQAAKKTPSFRAPDQQAISHFAKLFTAPPTREQFEVLLEI